MEQVADDDIEVIDRIIIFVCLNDVSQVRVNALAVLCNEFNNPYMIHGCMDAGVTPVLAHMISDPDFTTRERASRALSIAAADAVGIDFILSQSVVPDILKGASDPTIEVRTNTYKCLYNLTRVPEGINTVVEAGGPELLVKAVGAEDTACQPYMLSAIQNLVKTQRGLAEASFYKAVKVCIALLASESDAVVMQAARTLGFICFSDKEKDEAISENGVPVLCAILGNELSSLAVCSAVTSALMSITSTDEGKRQMGSSSGIEVVKRTLQGASDRIILVNTLKLISNCAVFPSSRALMAEDEAFLVKLEKLASSADSLLSRHAQLALKAVNFMP